MAKVAAERQFALDPSKLTRVQTRIPKVGGLPGRSASADATSDLGKAVGKFGNTLAGIGAINQARDEDREVQAKKTAFQQFIRDHRFGNEQKGIIGYATLQGAEAVTTREKYDKIISDEAARISGTSVSHRVNRNLPDALTGPKNGWFNFTASHQNAARVQAEQATDIAQGVEAGQNFVIAASSDPTDTVAQAEAASALGLIERLALKHQDRLGVPKDTESGKLIRKIAVQKAASLAITAAIENMLQGNDPTTLAKATALFNRADMQVRLTVEAKADINNKLEKKARENVALLASGFDNVKEVYNLGGTPPQPAVDALYDGYGAGIKSSFAKQRLKELDELRKHSDLIRLAHRAQSLVQQDNNINTLLQKLATDTMTGEEARLLKKLQKVTAHNRSEIAKGNGIELAAEYGEVPPLEKLNLTDPMSYKNRVWKAGIASRVFGAEIQPVTTAELKTINNMIMGKGLPGQLRDENEPTGKNVSPENVVKVLTAMAQGLGRETAESMAGKAIDADRTAAMVMAIGSSRPGLAAEMITGLRTRQSDPTAYPVTAKDRNTEVKTVLGTAFSGATGAMRKYISDAATALYTFEKSKAGGSDFDSALYRQAIQRVTGGMLDSGDNKVMAPVSGMTQGRFNDLVATLSPEVMGDPQFSITGRAPEFADGTPFDPKLFDKPFLSSGTDAHLFSMGFGKYGIINPGSGPVLDSNGDLYQIDLRAYHESGQATTAIAGQKKTSSLESALTSEAERLQRDIDEREKFLRQQEEDQAKPKPESDTPEKPEELGWQKAIKTGTPSEDGQDTPPFPKVGNQSSRGSADTLTSEEEADQSSRKPESTPAVRLALENIPKFEGARGDTATSTKTLEHGVTPSRLEDIRVKTGNPELSAKEAVPLILQDSFEQLSTKLTGFEGLPETAQAALVDLSFNLTPSRVAGFKGIKAAVEAGDVNLAMRETLDTAQADGHSFRGLARRRAVNYNTAITSGPKITTVEQLNDGINYLDAKGNIVFGFKKPRKKGKNGSPLGKIQVNQQTTSKPESADGASAESPWNVKRRRVSTIGKSTGIPGKGDLKGINVKKTKFGSQLQDKATNPEIVPALKALGSELGAPLVVTSVRRTQQKQNELMWEKYTTDRKTFRSWYLGAKNRALTEADIGEIDTLRKGTSAQRKEARRIFEARNKFRSKHVTHSAVDLRYPGWTSKDGATKIPDADKKKFREDLVKGLKKQGFVIYNKGKDKAWDEWAITLGKVFGKKGVHVFKEGDAIHMQFTSSGK
jgi:hypothetical protein